MRIKLIKLLFINLVGFLLISHPAAGQTVKDEMFADIRTTGGIFYAYPTPTQNYRAAPAGFTPFYISHYGRHGSRWLDDEGDFTFPLELLRKAKKEKALTANGISALHRLETIWEMAENRGGDLTPLGAVQHRQIAARMVKNFPEVFSSKAVVTAEATTVPRVVLSMANFVNSLIALNPGLTTTVAASNRFKTFLANTSKNTQNFRTNDKSWQEELRKFKEENTQTDRFIKNLFNDDEFVYRNVDPVKFMEKFYQIASVLQNINTEISFYDLFTKEELFDMYQTLNYAFYVFDGPSALNNKSVLNDQKPLLEDIVNRADDYIKENKSGATLRFGHDIYLIPLLALMDVEGTNSNETDRYKVYQSWNTYRISPMAGNLQLVFFKDNNGDILVKFLLNEREVSIPVDTDIFPFYRWQDVRNYFEKVVHSDS